MNKIEIENLIISILKEFIQENDIELIVDLNTETRLIGSSGLLDSMDLVSFIVELEEGISHEFSLDVELANDSAMSSRTSPFLNVSTLSDYILKITE
jgi:acyl carrier protein